MTTPPAQRRLVLVRHAEAGPAPVDADRELTRRGEREAVAVGRWLADAGVQPDHVVVSPARRTRQTWELAGRALGRAPRPVLDDGLYEGTVDSVLAVVRATAADVATLVVVGHNPPIGRLAHVLPAGPGARAGPGPHFPPGTAAVLALRVPFAALGPGEATLTGVRRPDGG